MRGLSFEEFEVGMHFDHALTRTVTEWDNIQFSTMILNPQPLHIDAHFSAKTEFRRPLPRLTAMLWGGEDLAGDLGVARNRDDAGAYRAPFLLARNLLLAAAAAECSAIDAVHVDYTNLDALATEATQARADGFAAKAAIHPAQVAPIQHAFTPSAAECAWALRVVAALADGGLAVVDGSMVDAPHLRMARRILS